MSESSATNLLSPCQASTVIEEYVAVVVCVLKLIEEVSAWQTVMVG